MLLVKALNKKKSAIRAANRKKPLAVLMVVILDEKSFMVTAIRAG